MDKTYRNKGQIGQGGSCKVYLVECVHSGRQLAMKEFEKSHLNDQYLLKLFESEVSVLQTLKQSDNRHLVRLEKVLNTPNHLYVLMEYCNQGSLNDYILAKGPLSEFRAVGILL